MFFPTKLKHRKWQRYRVNPNKKRVASRGNKVSFGAYGLKAEESGEIKVNQIEAARKSMARYLQKSGKMWVRIFANRPFVSRSGELGMGKGKGNPAGFMARVNPGRVLFEVDGLTEVASKEALRKAGSKLPVKTKIVIR